jgi:hypothetical protein
MILPVAAVVLFGGMPLTIGAVWLDSRIVPWAYRESEGPSMDWPEVCRVEAAHLLAPPGSRYAFLEHAARAWIVNQKTGQPEILLPNGRQAVPYSPPAGRENELKSIFSAGPEFDITFIDAGLRYTLFGSKVPSHLHKSWSDEHGYQFTLASIVFARQYAPGGCVIHDLIRNTTRDHQIESWQSCPLLSADSGWLASLDGTTFSQDGRLVKVEALDGGKHIDVNISKAGPGFVVIEDVSISHPRLLVRRKSSRLIDVSGTVLERRGFNHEYLEVSFDGTPLWRLPRVGDGNSDQVLLGQGGWVWWQSDSEAPGCCQMEWQTAAGHKKHNVARGRSIVSVSLDPGAEFLAISVSDRHNTGQVQDSVYVIRTRDGSEVFRRYLPPLTRSRVQFLGEESLAYTEFDGKRAFVRMVKVAGRRGGNR